MGIDMYRVNGLIALSILGLTACGGGGGSGGSSTVVNNGVFKDTNVSGLSYESGGQTGVTSQLGAFKYEEGEVVSFNVGGVNLGSGEGKSVMTPLDLVTNGKLATPEVINKVRFLMMLDKDNTQSNGIDISQKVQDVADDWSAIDFAADDFPTSNAQDIRASASAADAEFHSFPSIEAATAHLRSTLLCANAGAFKGTYAGSESGSIVFVVDPVTGEVNGSSYNPDNQVSVEVKSTTAIDYDAGLSFVSSEDSIKAFSGILRSADDIDGTWEDASDTRLKGTFDGERFGSKSDSVERYVASFIGGDKGAFTFNVDKSNKITGTAYSLSTGEETNLKGNINNEYKLTATSDAGDEITGFIDVDTLAFTTGQWINGEEQTGGSFTGGGCRLN